MIHFGLLKNAFCQEKKNFHPYILWQVTKCLQYHYKIVRFKCYNNAEYGNSSSADSRLRTGGELAWTTTTIEIIRDPEGATIPPIAGRAAQGAAIRRPAENRIPNGDLRLMIEAPIARTAGIPRRIEALPARIAVTRRRIEAHPVRIVVIPRRAEAHPARNAAILPPTERIMARAAPLPAAAPAHRVPALATRPPQGAHPAPAGAPAEAAMAVPPVHPAHRERRKRSAATNFAFSRDSSL